MIEESKDLSVGVCETCGLVLERVVDQGRGVCPNPLCESPGASSFRWTMRWIGFGRFGEVSVEALVRVMNECLLDENYSKLIDVELDMAIERSLALMFKKGECE